MYSERIEDFLQFLRDAVSNHQMDIEDENKTNTKTQDLLHCLELEKNSYYDIAKIAKTLVEVRQERRGYKTDRECLEPIVDWVNENQSTLRQLEKLLGEVRKIERRNENRSYFYRTDIVQIAKGTKQSTSKN